MEKMRSGELYCFAAPELQESFERAATLCARMRTMTVYDGNYRKTIEDLTMWDELSFDDKRQTVDQLIRVIYATSDSIKIEWRI